MLSYAMFHPFLHLFFSKIDKHVNFAIMIVFETNLKVFF